MAENTKKQIFEKLKGLLHSKNSYSLSINYRDGKYVIDKLGE